METNLGPNFERAKGVPSPVSEMEDPALDRLQEPFDASLGNISWGAIESEKQRKNRLHFNAVLANKRFKTEVGKRLSNALFHCNCEKFRNAPSGVDCYKGLAKVFCRTPAVSNEVIYLFNPKS